MYCSNCGNSVNEKLKYCNSCGEKLVRDEDEKTPTTMLDSILETVFWSAILGFGILVGLIVILLRNEVPPQFIVLIAIAYLATIFGICFTLLLQVPKLINAKLRSDRDVARPEQLYSRNTAQLEEHREPVDSVTAHTTRALDNVMVERK